MKRIGDSNDDRELLGLALERHGRRPSCPTDEQLSAWFEKALSPAEARWIAEHTDSCASCGELSAAYHGAVAAAKRRWRRLPWIAAAAVLAAVAVLMFTTGGDAVTRAEVALAAGEPERAAALLDDHLARLTDDERQRQWPHLVALFAGGWTDGAATPAAPPRFRAPGLVPRTIRYPVGTIREPRPTFVATASGPAARLVVERDEGPATDYREIFAVDLPADADGVAFPTEAADLTPGYYALTVRGDGVIASVHAFTVKTASPFLRGRLDRIDAATSDAMLRRLARCRVLWEAGFEGDALHELLQIPSPPAAVAAWRQRLEQNL